MDLITDRTELDVTNETSKGFYNVEDLIRVESAVLEIIEKLRVTQPSMYNAVKNIVTKTDWQKLKINTDYSIIDSSEMINQAQMERYIGNIKQLQSVFHLSFVFPNAMNGLTYEDANNIERCLTFINQLIEISNQVWAYCNEKYCGEV